MLTRDFQKEIGEVGSFKSFIVRELEIGLPWAFFGALLALKLTGQISGWTAAIGQAVALLVATLVTLIVAW